MYCKKHKCGGETYTLCSKCVDEQAADRDAAVDLGCRMMQKVKEQQERLQEYETAYRKIMDEQCAADERHCTCVPALKTRVRDLECANEDGRQVRLRLVDRVEALEAGLQTIRDSGTWYRTALEIDTYNTPHSGMSLLEMIESLLRKED